MMQVKAMLEDLLVEFDEYGFSPQITMPDAEEFAKQWREKLVEAIQKYETHIREQSGDFVKGYECGVNEGWDNAVDELKAKIEQRTLIELPCKVGDTIYVPWRYDGVEGISLHEVTAIEINKDGLYLVFYIDTDVYYLWDNTYNRGRFNLSWLGIKFFLSREEAEKRLKELQE